jgi:uncharacterized Zn finger protein (UPF0148 family)
MSGLPEGQCFRCKVPLFIETGNMRPLCTECEKKVNNFITRRMAAKGKNIKGKTLIFPKTPEAPEDDAA